MEVLTREEQPHGRASTTGQLRWRRATGAHRLFNAETNTLARPTREPSEWTDEHGAAAPLRSVATADGRGRNPLRGLFDIVGGRPRAPYVCSRNRKSYWTHDYLCEGRAAAQPLRKDLTSSAAAVRSVIIAALDGDCPTGSDHETAWPI